MPTSSAQWTLNALWTPLFFGLHRPGLAFAEIIVLDLAVLATLIAYRPLPDALFSLTPQSPTDCTKIVMGVFLSS